MMGVKDMIIFRSGSNEKYLLNHLISEIQFDTVDRILEIQIIPKIRYDNCNDMNEGKYDCKFNLSNIGNDKVSDIISSIARSIKVDGDIYLDSIVEYCSK